MKMRYRLLICVLGVVLVGGYLISKAIYTIRTAELRLACEYNGGLLSLYGDSSANSALVIHGWKFRKVYFSWYDTETEGALDAFLVNKNGDTLYTFDFNRDEAELPTAAWIGDAKTLLTDKPEVYVCTGKIRRQK